MVDVELSELEYIKLFAGEGTIGIGPCSGKLQTKALALLQDVSTCHEFVRHVILSYCYGHRDVSKMRFCRIDDRVVQSRCHDERSTSTPLKLSEPMTCALKEYMHSNWSSNVEPFLDRAMKNFDDECFRVLVPDSESVLNAVKEVIAKRGMVFGTKKRKRQGFIARKQHKRLYIDSVASR